jgi:hypothetical protein
MLPDDGVLSMKLVTVNCSRAQGETDDEPRVGVTIANDRSEAEQLCRCEYETEGYIRFEVKDIIEGEFAGPARVLGYTGQNPLFQWRP